MLHRINYVLAVITQVNETGYHIIQLGYSNVEMRAGWMLGVVQTSASAILKSVLGNDKHPLCNIYQKSDQPESIARRVGSCPQTVPAINMYLSKGFSYKGKLPKPNQLGVNNITVSASSSDTPNILRVSKVIYVQVIERHLFSRLFPW